jgi:hypothetical protein
MKQAVKWVGKLWPQTNKVEFFADVGKVSDIQSVDSWLNS